MNISPVGSPLQAFQTSSVTSQDPLSLDPSAATPTIDTSSISSAALFLNQLSQLQQQNPGQFSQVMIQIGDRIKQAAQGALNSGNSRRVAQLNQLATEFQNAANGRQLPRRCNNCNMPAFPDTISMAAIITAACTRIC